MPSDGTLILPGTMMSTVLQMLQLYQIGLKGYLNAHGVFADRCSHRHKYSLWSCIWPWNM